jgi:hypothetical protein
MLRHTDHALTPPAVILLHTTLKSPTFLLFPRCTLDLQTIYPIATITPQQHHLPHTKTYRRQVHQN